MRIRAAFLGAVVLAFASTPALGQAPPPATQAAPPAAAAAPAQTSVTPEQAALLKSTEAYVREFFGWAPDVKVELGPLGASASSNFYVVPIHVTLNGQVQSGDVYVSRDGKTMVRGEILDMSVDPFAANREKEHIDGNPSKGPADARVTVVEFADFECPHCRELYEALKALETQYPQVRFVYKDFPLTNIHPWAQTAALGGRCAFQQSPEAFWKMHNAIFDNQDVISPENVWDKLVGFATDAGLNVDTFKACLSSADAEKAVDANHADGVALDVNSTPTVYVNGRPVVGGDLETLERFIAFELAEKK